MTSESNILQRIVTRRRQRIEAEGSALPRPNPTFTSQGGNAFVEALDERRGRAVIAEVKLGSPSLGSLVDSVRPVELAQAYRRAGAAALSVVVEPDFFFGSYGLLADCHQASGLPAIAKDFIVDPVQLLWAKEAGASAILLIASLYDQAELRAYARQARALGLVPLIETHDQADLAKLAGATWELVGVNNRDLVSFDVEIATSLALASSLPHGAICVSESGIESPRDVAALRNAGFDAFLIGTSLIRSGDPEGLLAALIGGDP